MMRDVAGAAKCSVENTQIRAAQTIAGPHRRVQRILLGQAPRHEPQQEKPLGFVGSEDDAAHAHSTR